MSEHRADASNVEPVAASTPQRGLWELLLTATLAGVRPDERGAFNAAFKAALERPITRRRALALRFSAILQTLIGLQVVTGIWLALGYRPSVDDALDSLHAIESTTLGWLARQAHHWSGRLIVVMAVLFLVRHLVVAAYKRRGRLKWAAAFGILVLSVCSFATGALLPRDAAAVGATTRLAHAFERWPLIGRLLANWIAGGGAQSDGALARSFTLHAVLLPWLFFILLLILFSVVTRPRAGSAAASGERVVAPPLWPDRSLDVATTVVVTLGLVLIALLVWPVELGPPPVEGSLSTHAVDPVLRPFTTIEGMLGDGWGAVTAMSFFFLILLGLFFVPWLDGGEETQMGRRYWFVIPAVAVLLALVAMMLFGEGGS